MFDIAELRELTAYDELELDTLGDPKSALFIIISDTDDTFNFLVSLCYTQLFNLLCEKADDVYGGRLPVHVRCLIDECANIGQIPRLEKLMATIRSRELSACLVLQTQSQLKAQYKGDVGKVADNKAANGSLTDWNNLLLACKYCNTRKGKKSGSVNINEYLWPDVYNTAIAFTYKDGVPEVSEEALNTIDQTGEALRKAKTLFELLKLDVLQRGAEKDKRNRKRNEVYEIAQESLRLWKEFDYAKSIKTQITNNAKACGFFSIWMEVFREEPEMLEAFIEVFPGTRKECFDENGHPKYELMESNNPW